MISAFYLIITLPDHAYIKLSPSFSLTAQALVQAEAAAAALHTPHLHSLGGGQGQQQQLPQLPQLPRLHLLSQFAPGQPQ